MRLIELLQSRTLSRRINFFERRKEKKKKEIPRDTRIFSNGGATQVIGSGTRQLLIGSIFEAMHRDPCLVHRRFFILARPRKSSPSPKNNHRTREPYSPPLPVEKSATSNFAENSKRNKIGIFAQLLYQLYIGRIVINAKLYRVQRYTYNA